MPLLAQKSDSSEDEKYGAESAISQVGAGFTAIYALIRAALIRWVDKIVHERHSKKSITR